MSLQSVIITTLKAKVSNLLAKGKEGIKKLFDIRPRDDKDYYSVLHWMVSKRLAFSLAILTIVLCGCFLAAMLPGRDAVEGGNPVKAYRYNAIPLKYISGKVKILGKSGYQAYVGEVAKGSVTGEGTLYFKNGDILYTGEFDHNQYQGSGQLYYENNILKYQGGFRENKFQGEGILYRQDGTEEYEGSFSQNLKDGNGMLYDNSGNLVYTGIFRKDRIVYQELMNKTTEEVASMYTGRKVVYDSDNAFCVSMPDIGAVYSGVSGEETLDEEWKVKGIYVLDSTIILEGEQVSDIRQVREHLGAPIYEGNTAISIEDAVAIREASYQQPVLHGKVMMEITQVLGDVIQIKAYDNSYLAYLYIFKKDGYTYTFFCQEKEAAFAFYLMEGE